MRIELRMKDGHILSYPYDRLTPPPSAPASDSTSTSTSTSN